MYGQEQVFCAVWVRGALLLTLGATLFWLWSVPPSFTPFSPCALSASNARYACSQIDSLPRGHTGSDYIRARDARRVPPASTHSPTPTERASTRPITSSSSHYRKYPCWILEHLRQISFLQKIGIRPLRMPAVRSWSAPVPASH
jgi:hypothetical protein